MEGATKKLPPMHTVTVLQHIKLPLCVENSVTFIMPPIVEVPFLVCMPGNIKNHLSSIFSGHQPPVINQPQKPLIIKHQEA
jgi:hypothetical protein